MGLDRGGGPRIRVGIVGLGRLWESRHKPALARLRDRFHVVAVYDQVARRASIEAASLRCEVARGLSGLIERPDIEAIYLLTPQWFGLHPIAQACEAGKPIYCAVPPGIDPEGLEAVAEVVRQSKVPFMPEMARRFYPASLRLRELLETTLGPVRLVLGHTRLFGFDRYNPPGPSTQLAPVPLSIDPCGFLLDWCRFVFGDEPTKIEGRETQVMPGPLDDGSGPDFAGFSLEFAGSRAVRMDVARYHRAAWGDASRFLPPPGFQVFAERGAAWVEMPDRIQWSDASGIHEERLPMEPTVGEVLNDQFYRLVRGEPSLAPGLEDALAVVRWGRELRSG